MRVAFTHLRALFLSVFVMVLPFACVLPAATTSTSDAPSNADGGDGANGTLAIGGTVTGLEGASVELVLNGGEKSTVNADGPFHFKGLLSPGAPYAVTVGTSPTMHACSIVNGSGTVAQADITNITVACPSTDTALTNLSLSPGVLAPTFASGTTMYTANAEVTSLVTGQPTGTLTATTRSPGATLALGVAKLISGKPTPLMLAVGMSSVNVAVTAADGKSKANYRVDVNGTRGAEEAYLKASNTIMAQAFGASVALSGDTLAVGVPGDASAASGVNGDPTGTAKPGSGAVFVFVRKGSAWTQQAYIKAQTSKAGFAFGQAVALEGDTLAVGVIHDTSNQTGSHADDSGANSASPDSGAVYVYVRTGTTWAPQAYIKASNTIDSASFGASIALSQDTLAVGAPLESCKSSGINGNQSNCGSFASGAAYVFTRSGATWTQEAYVKASNALGSQLFGGSVSLTKAGNTLAVGAAGESSNAKGINGAQADVSAMSAGAVYVFTRAGTWSQEAYVKASNTLANQRFGAAMSIVGDTLAVGAPGEASAALGIDGDQTNVSAVGAGAVYVFTRAVTVWSQQAYVKASNTLTNQGFGGSLALLGDNLAVGALGESSGATGIGGNQGDTSLMRAGAVYLFLRGGTAWSQTAYVKSSNTQADQDFGAALALSSDTLVVGAVKESSSAKGINGDQKKTDAPGAGATYVFR